MSVDAVATAISEGFKLIANILSGSDKRRIRKLIDAGEQYILANENPSLHQEDRRKLLDKYRKRFFKYN